MKEIEMRYYTIPKEIVESALVDCGYYILTAAKLLGIGRTSLYGYIRHYKIKIPLKELGVKPQWEINNKKCNNIYYKMINRCYNPKNKDYKYYGGRGIKVYDGWLNCRDSFTRHVMGLENFGKDGYSLDRINNNGKYEPGNVKFSTGSEQSRNTRKNCKLILDGIEYLQVEFAEKFQLSQNFIKDRLKLGFTPEEIIKIPKGVKRSTYYKNQLEHFSNH